MLPVECENFPEQIARGFDDFVLRLHTSSSQFLQQRASFSSRALTTTSGTKRRHS